MARLSGLAMLPTGAHRGLGMATKALHPAGQTRVFRLKGLTMGGAYRPGRGARSGTRTGTKVSGARLAGFSPKTQGRDSRGRFA